MALTPKVVEFSRSEPGALVDRLRAIADRGDGKGWANLGPALTDEEYASVPHRSGLGAWFSGRGPAVPMATWTPAQTRGSASQVGVSHGTGPSALSRLEDGGLALPPTWMKKQDHAKHGIVAEVPADVDYAAMVDWLIRAMSHLSAVVATGDRWIAEVYESG